MEHNHTTLVWFRNDLRIDDHQALHYASRRGRVVPVYIRLPDDSSQTTTIGGASKWWLHHSLESLARDLKTLGSPLILRIGAPAHVLTQLCTEVGATRVAIHESLDPRHATQDDAIEIELNRVGIEVVRFAPNLLWPIGSVLSNAAKPYQVFTHFWNRGRQTVDVEQPIESPKELRPPHKAPSSVTLKTLDLNANASWASGFGSRWEPGESGATNAFNEFCNQRIQSYHTDRDRLDIPGWSALSAPLHFGELSVRRIWYALTAKLDWDTHLGTAAFLRQLGWRDFAIHLLNQFPHTSTEPLREQFDLFPWVSSPDHLRRWQQGMTGFPVVDAAMRNLWTQGWMPNRARMIVASFLCKDLLISWTEGAAWFMDTLVDADLANNTLGWQWTAGCGADASPFFRVFNPVTQGQKFDPDGEYIRTWVPELAKLSSKDIHAPWDAHDETLCAAGVTLGKDYPHPIVDHAQARLDALSAYATITK